MSDESRTAGPGSKAGQEGGDEEHQQTDEERMIEEIVKQKELIDALPSGDTARGVVRRALYQRKLGQLEFQYQILLEKKRLPRELSKFEEMYGVVHSEPCLICLEDIHIHASGDLVEVFNCCGGFICKACVRNLHETKMGLSQCPLCREPFTANDASKRAAQVMALAQRGVSWAQAGLGNNMINGTRGLKKQEKAGLEWLNKAVAQNYPLALYELSHLYRNGLASVLRKSQENANKLLLQSANLGHSASNFTLAKFHMLGTDGFEKNIDEAYFRASVSYALDDTNENTALTLGYMHCNECLPEPSPYLACYYANMAASTDTTTGAACYLYVDALSRLVRHLHDGYTPNGSNVLPAMIFWWRKSRDLGNNDAVDKLEKIESIGQISCGNCSKKAEAGEKFKQCSKCKAQWYCSKECQVEAWRAGHKKDCKRARILKFEDYINSE